VNTYELIHATNVIFTDAAIKSLGKPNESNAAVAEAKPAAVKKAPAAKKASAPKAAKPATAKSKKTEG
jgi:hypothetical protein